MTGRGSGYVRKGCQVAVLNGGPRQTPEVWKLCRLMNFRPSYGTATRPMPGQRPCGNGSLHRQSTFFLPEGACVPETHMLIVCPMSTEIKYRGKAVSAKDIDFINRLIADHPNDSRRALSVKLCREWNWVQANGAYRDMVCRGLMLLLHRSGHIELPARKLKPNNPFVNRKKPVAIEIDQSPINTSLAGLDQLEMQQVRNTQDEALFNSLIECHHYLGYCHPVGEHLKYIVYAGKRPIACFSWSSAPRHIGCRDRFIGWTQQHRGRHLHFMAYNSRYPNINKIQTCQNKTA
jgi:hypothetical protein